MKLDSLIIPNLGRLGLERIIAAPNPDLPTIWNTPYPVLRTYSKFCKALKIEPYGGGTMKEQKKGSGRITSGYRSEVLEGNEESAHRLAIALDIAFSLSEQIEYAEIASQFFCRVGLYPDRWIMHVDLAPDNWIKKYNKARYWVYAKNRYHSFKTIESAINFAG